MAQYKPDKRLNMENKISMGGEQVKSSPGLELVAHVLRNAHCQSYMYTNIGAL